MPEAWAVGVTVAAARSTVDHHDMVATIVRVVPVRLIEISRGGCRFESPIRLDQGASGTLTLELDGAARVDDVRVARCQRKVGGSAAYHVGVELLKTRRLGRRSIRMAVRKLIGDFARGAGQPPGATGRPLTLAPWASEKRLQAAGRAPPAGPDRGS